MKDFFSKYPKAPCYYEVGDQIFYAHQKDRAELEARSKGLKVVIVKNPDKTVKPYKGGIGATVVDNEANEKLRAELDKQQGTTKTSTRKTTAKKTTAKKTTTKTDKT